MYDDPSADLGCLSMPALFFDYSLDYSLYHVSVLLCVSVFTEDGRRMATETFEYFLFNVTWLVQCSISIVMDPPSHTGQFAFITE